MIDYVTGFMFSPDKVNVALICKLKPAWQNGLLNGIGGKMEVGETPEIAIAREFLEETGVETKSKDWKHFVTLITPDFYRVNFLYSVDTRIDLIKTNENEVVGIYNVRNLPKNVISNLNWLIPMALDENLKFEKPMELIESERRA